MADSSKDIPGLPARRAALRLLDAVFRRGETLDIAFAGATKDLRKFEDKALARAIASEVLRWLVDLDALIDSATKQPLPHDAKARMVLRMMLAQWLRLGTPPHAVVATGLDLLAGGPRRLGLRRGCGDARADVSAPQSARISQCLDMGRRAAAGDPARRGLSPAHPPAAAGDGDKGSAGLGGNGRRGIGGTAVSDDDLGG